MKKALIVIDYVNDFVADAGALTCGKIAQDIDEYLAALVTKFSGDGELIVNAYDCHDLADCFSPEKKLFPPHCICGTDGAELYGQTKAAVEKVDSGQLLTVKKYRYSAFAGTELDLKLRERRITDLYLTGVCSDICVLHTAADAYNLGYKASVYAKAAATFNSRGHEFALKHVKDVLGFDVIES